MIMDERWKTYKGDGKSVVDSKAREVKHCIVDDQWWDTLDYLLNLTRPIIDFIRAADTDSPILHLVYDMWDSMIEEIKTVVFRHEEKDLLVGQSAFFDAIHEILEERWNKSNTPLHCLAHSFVPKYYTDSWLKDGDGVQRLAPHEDQEVSMNRVKCFKRIFEDPNDLRKVCMEYGEFSSATGLFSDSFIKEARVFEEPISWWANYGSRAKFLQSLAFKLLSQPTSSSCCERNWSTYSQIQNLKRNKLTSSRAEDLVYVHTNMRLLSRKKNSYKEGPSRYWDICGDKFDIDRDMNQLADLSINEPELETITFDNSLDMEKDGNDE
ncbi:Unknown protein [Striga hermonthica]|uniref:HAT C-terminal dimerisation domain-containing protein n=1 Tax=Striga hermonthica TaxID=68872 RepID=A0A9N7MJ96_STRHE|nr:Unknown protein [Striga hermonthica]